MLIGVCPTGIEPQEVEVESSKGDGTTYTVTTPTMFGNDAICGEDCAGYRFRGKCRHIAEAIERGVCFYGTRDLDEEKCPKCGRDLIGVIVPD